jgi:hypothetical protein
MAPLQTMAEGSKVSTVCVLGRGERKNSTRKHYYKASQAVKFVVRERPARNQKSFRWIVRYFLGSLRIAVIRLRVSTSN